MNSVILTFKVEVDKTSEKITADICKTMGRGLTGVDEPILINVDVVNINAENINLQLLLNETEGFSRNMDSAIQTLYQYMCEYALPQIKFEINPVTKPKYRVAIEKAYSSNLSDVKTIELRHFKASDQDTVIECNNFVESISNNLEYVLDNGEIIPFQTLGEFFTRDDGLTMEYISHDKEYPSGAAIKTLLREAMREKNDKYVRFPGWSRINTIDLFSLPKESLFDKSIRELSSECKQQLYSMLTTSKDSVEQLTSLIGSEL